jgi:hypothetical protein
MTISEMPRNKANNPTQTSSSAPCADRGDQEFVDHAEQAQHAQQDDHGRKASYTRAFLP